MRTVLAFALVVLMVASARAGPPDPAEKAGEALLGAARAADVKPVGSEPVGLTNVFDGLTGEEQALVAGMMLYDGAVDGPLPRALLMVEGALPDGVLTFHAYCCRGEAQARAVYDGALKRWKAVAPYETGFHQKVAEGSFAGGPSFLYTSIPDENTRQVIDVANVQRYFRRGEVVYSVQLQAPVGSDVDSYARLLVKELEGTGPSGGVAPPAPAPADPLDFNGDGRVNAVDALRVLRAARGGGAAPAAMDVNGDGRVTEADAQALLDLSTERALRKLGRPLDAPLPPKPPELEEAEARCTAAYNRLTKLMAAGQGDTEEAKRAWADYQKARKAYDEVWRKHHGK
jgi:hypothetical protein